jgi:hypothetical protein
MVAPLPEYAAMPVEPAPALFAGVTPESEDALVLFDTAYESFEPDQSLLEGTPARSLTQAMLDMVEMLRRIDIDRVARRQGWWSRFTGADLEARIELEVGAQKLGTAMRGMAEHASAARRAQMAMRTDLPRLDAAQATYQALADATHDFLRGSDASHPVVARLHRRLGNLEALYTSNRLVRAQMVMAIDNLSGLLDRFTDIEQLLFPVWQHHALAVAQGLTNIDDASNTLHQLRTIHARFEGAFASKRDQRP